MFPLRLHSLMNFLARMETSTCPGWRTKLKSKILSWDLLLLFTYIVMAATSSFVRKGCYPLLAVASLSGLSVYEHSLKYKVHCRLMIPKYVRKTVFKIKWLIELIPYSVLWLSLVICPNKSQFVERNFQIRRKYRIHHLCRWKLILGT